jgi:putative ATP-binding cassette transporter
MSVSTATTSEPLVTRETARRFVAAIRSFATSEVRGQAALLFAALITSLVALNALNVLNSYVGRDFVTAIEQRDHARFVREGWRYVAVFGLSTVVAVLYRYGEERIGLLWRNWLTARLVRAYLANRTYRRLADDGGLANPDQRIAEDVRYFVTTTLSLALLQLNASLTVVAFSGVLWSISRTLFLVGILYAVSGSLLTVLLGRRLMHLNYEQSDREADFRTALIHVREHADRVALLHREEDIQESLLDRLRVLVGNMRRIIDVNRNVGFFTTGYNYMIQIIPALIVAPLFIRGEVDFGVVTQSAMAFTHLLGAFSLVVTQFPTISSYAAVLARLNALTVGIRHGRTSQPKIDTIHDDRIAYEALTLRAAGAERVLVDRLSLSIPRGTRVVIGSRDAMARGALMRATAGVWDDGTGRVRRPPLERVAFVPERPYMLPGTLRELMRGRAIAAPSDAEIHTILASLDAEGILARAGGIDVPHDWERLLSQREQTLLSVAHLAFTRPWFALIDNVGRTLGPEPFASVLDMFTRLEITYVVMGGADVAAPCDLVLQLADDGHWTVHPGTHDAA